MINSYLVKLNSFIKLLLLKCLLPQLIAKRSPDEYIPRSGKKAEKVNCYTVGLYNEDGKLTYTVTGFNKTENSLEVLSRDRAKSTLDLNDIPLDRFIIIHYYGLYELVYSSVYDLLVFNWFFKYDLLKVKLRQYFLNQRKSAIKNSMKLLGIMLHYELNPKMVPYSWGNEEKGVDIISLMTILYSEEWLYFQDENNDKEKIEKNLELLCDSGDLKKTVIDYSCKYSITGQGLRTLETYQENENRHRDIFWLTLLLAFVAIIQVMVSYNIDGKSALHLIVNEIIVSFKWVIGVFSAFLEWLIGFINAILEELKRLYDFLRVICKSYFCS